jgi:hypothetical protein
LAIYITRSASKIRDLCQCHLLRRRGASNQGAPAAETLERPLDRLLLQIALVGLWLQTHVLFDMHRRRQGSRSKSEE